MYINESYVLFFVFDVLKRSVWRLSTLFSDFFQCMSVRRREFHRWGRQAWPEALGTAGKDGNDSVYEKLQLMANLAVIGVLFRWFYGYLLILGIFPLLGGVCR